MKIKSHLFKNIISKHELAENNGKYYFSENEPPSGRFLAQQYKEMMLGTLSKKQQHATMKVLKDPHIMLKVLHELQSTPTPYSIANSLASNNQFKLNKNKTKRKQLPKKLMNSPPADNLDIVVALDHLNLSKYKTTPLTYNSDTPINSEVVVLNCSTMVRGSNLDRGDSSESVITLCNSNTSSALYSEKKQPAANLKRREAVVKSRLVSKCKDRVVNFNNPIKFCPNKRNRSIHYFQRAHLCLKLDPEVVTTKDVKVYNKHGSYEDICEGWNDDLDPPKDSVSIYVYWWGYEVYLPTVFLQQFQKDSSSLNSVLKFLTTLLALVPVVLPFMAVITSFLTLQGDVLSMLSSPTGCILTATWFLPIVVIPRPWRL